LGEKEMAGISRLTIVVAFGVVLALTVAWATHVHKKKLQRQTTAQPGSSP
jgi:hypothetical protein